MQEFYEPFFGKVIKSETAKKKAKEGLEKIIKEIPEIINQSPYTEEEIKDLLLSACLSSDFKVCEVYKKGRKIHVDWNKKNIKSWFEKKLIPNTVILSLEDSDILELLLFSIEFAFCILEGKTKATRTQKGFRERSRELETIVVNTFTGLVGEVGIKKFLEKNFKVEIKLDRSISPNIEEHKSDIPNAKYLISVKTTPNLRGVWAECPKGFDYGIFTKAVVPSALLLRAFAHACAFKKFVDFSKEKISFQKEITSIVTNLENRFYTRKCGNLDTKIKIFICGYFETNEGKLIPVSQKLPLIRIINEERFFIPISNLKYTRNDWLSFVKKNF